MAIDLVIVFLALSLVLYAVLGGADFGAGLLELATPSSLRKDVRTLIKLALGPVWEANHMWLIIAVVIMFVAFPRGYSLILTHFHIPVTLLLIGIVLRGCAFTFRHYDPSPNDHGSYSLLFIVGSLIAPLMMGITVAGLLFGKIALHPSTFYEAYITPWLSIFGILVGVFTLWVFGYLAAVFCVGEVHLHRSHLRFPSQTRKFFFRMAIRLAAAMIGTGMLIMGIGWAYGTHFYTSFFGSKLAIPMMAGATITLVISLSALLLRKYWVARFLSSASVGSVVLGWIWIRFPILMDTTEGPISLLAIAGPPATIRLLLIALLAGCFIIFPALYMLFYVFKR